MATATSIFAERIRKAFRAVGIGVAPATSTADGSVPLITAGSGAASASDPNGSLHLRTDGIPEARLSGAWKQVLLSGTGVTLSAEVTGNGSSQDTAHGLGVVPSVVFAIASNLSGGVYVITYGTHDS